MTAASAANQSRTCVKGGNLPDLVKWLTEFVTAAGYLTSLDERVLVASERRGLDPPLRILAGRASSITHVEIRNRLPRHIVVEDDPTAADVERLRLECDRAREDVQLWSVSRFVDQLWLAKEIAKRSQDDARRAEDVSTLGPEVGGSNNPMDRYVDQWLRVEANGRHEYALKYVETEWMGTAAAGSSILAVLGSAGSGKSELVRVLQWRAATTYLAREKASEFSGLPPLALRVSVRDLPALSLERFTEYLRPFDETFNPKLVGQLLRYGRLVLLLDGLDEFRRPSEIDDGLRDLLALTSFGAQILVTSRTGYFTEGPVREALGDHLVAELEPLHQAGSVALLEARYGVPAPEARFVVDSLPNPVRGYPLFVLLAWVSGYRGGEYLSDMSTLREMTRRFCARERDRFGIEEDRQMEGLRNLASNTFMLGPVSPRDLLDEMGEDFSLFVEGPHPLLAKSEDGLMFRDETFYALFLSDEIYRTWQLARDESLIGWLTSTMGAQPLTPLAADYLAELAGPDAIRLAWEASQTLTVGHERLVRGNLLRIALKRVHLDAASHPAPERSEALRRLVGARDLRRTDLAGLVVERFDFRSWDLTGCNGDLSHFAYCAFAGASWDPILEDADFVGCTGIKARSSREKLLRRGHLRLERILRPWRNYAVSVSKLHLELAVDAWGIDPFGMDVLLELGLAEAVGDPVGIWRLTASGLRLLEEFALRGRTGNPELEDLLVALGRAMAGTGISEEALSTN